MKFIDKGELQECKECKDGDCGECELITERFEIIGETYKEIEWLEKLLSK